MEIKRILPLLRGQHVQHQSLSDTFSQIQRPFDRNDELLAAIVPHFARVDDLCFAAKQNKRHRRCTTHLSNYDIRFQSQCVDLDRLSRRCLQFDGDHYVGGVRITRHINVE